MAADQQQASLQRQLGLPLVTFYGLGTIIGAGIYVLVSEVAHVSGTMMPLAFLVAGVTASLTGLCYAELCSRFPHAAGAVLYVDKAFRRAWLSQLTGLLVLLTGIVSAATISRGFVGYLDLYWHIDTSLAIIGLCLVMGTITSLGIRESAWAITLITLLEIAGLLFVLSFVTTGQAVTEQAQEVQMSGLGPVALGAFLAFYAFIGFEDMVNLAEEVHEPETNLPRAIVLSIGVSGVMYVAIAVTAVRFIDLTELAASNSPMAVMVGNSPTAVAAIGVIGMVAISNGALTQIIMASRMLYGMAQRQLLPASFGKINARTQTPVLNTWLVTFVILGFALWLPVVTLAQLTSFIMLVIFALVNVALLRVKARATGDHPAPVFTVPAWVPIAGLIANSCLLGYQIWAW
jgi:APA family basic amino acid/polyamine antiporter